jgi:hypothetical protein
MPSSYNSHFHCGLRVTVTHFMCCDLWSDLAQLQTMVHCCNMVVKPELPAQPGFCPQGCRELIQGPVERNTLEPPLEQGHSGWKSFHYMGRVDCQLQGDLGLDCKRYMYSLQTVLLRQRQHSQAPDRGNLYLLPCPLVGTAYDVENCPHYTHRMNTHWRPSVALRMKCTGFSIATAPTLIDKEHLDKVIRLCLMWYTIHIVYLISIPIKIFISLILHSLSFPFKKCKIQVSLYRQ